MTTSHGEADLPGPMWIAVDPFVWFDIGSSTTKENTGLGTYSTVTARFFAVILAIAAFTLALPGTRTAHIARAAGSCSSADPSGDYADNGSNSWGTDAGIEANFHIGRSGDGCPDLSLPAGTSGYDTWTPQQQMLWLFNQEREIRGFSDLTPDYKLMSQVATNHSLEMGSYGYFAHQSPINVPRVSPPTSYQDASTTVQARLTSNPATANWTCWGENIFAGGSGTAAEAVYSYMYEDAGSLWGHRHNILGITPECGVNSGNFNYAGIGIVSLPGSPYGTYFTDDFLQLSSYSPPSTVDAQAPALDAPTYSGTTATVTNVVDATPAGSGASGITGVVFYVDSISAGSNSYGDWFNVVPATDRGGGTWTATIGSLNGGVLHAVAVDGSGNYTDCDAEHGSCGTPPGPAFTSMNLIAGWNALGIPSTSYPSTSSLANDLQGQNAGLQVRAAATYGLGRFAVYVPGYSANVPLAQGVGVFVLSSASGSWMPKGTPAGGAVQDTLRPGWNLVSIAYPSSLTASHIYSSLSSFGGSEVALYNGGWQVYGAGGGTNFTLDRDHAVMVLVRSGGSWTP